MNIELLALTAQYNVQVLIAFKAAIINLWLLFRSIVLFCSVSMVLR